ncbi:MAG: DUF4105 domain-containing protein [Treponema sp.]|nr:DUF4105 domain-containing protein [Treponema sp.]
MKASSRRGIFLAFLLFTGIALFLPAQEDAGRGEGLTLKVAVIGPGDELYFWWGHIALVIEDASEGSSWFYDWGIFSFDADRFFSSFAMGRLVYMCGVSPADLNYRVYRRSNRDITLYTLDMSPEKKEEIRRFAENNVLPENRAYLYHHFKHNCTGPLLNIIDMITDGQFRSTYEGVPGRFTLRQHVRRHTWFNPLLDWILNFWMGQDIDTPITVWQEMFLPSEVGTRIGEFSYTDENGAARKLVSDIEVGNRSVNRPPVLDKPRLQWPRELCLGVFIALVLFLIRFFGRNPKFKKAETALRRTDGILQAGLGLFFGIAGSLLFFLTFFTDHDYTWHNSNVIFVNFLLLAAVPLGIIRAFSAQSRRRFMAERFLEFLWTYVFLGGLVSILIKLSPGFWQQNQVTQALVMPWAFALSVFPGRIALFFRKK